MKLVYFKDQYMTYFYSIFFFVTSQYLLSKLYRWKHPLQVGEPGPFWINHNKIKELLIPTQKQKSLRKLCIFTMKYYPKTETLAHFIKKSKIFLDFPKTQILKHFIIFFYHLRAEIIAHSIKNLFFYIHVKQKCLNYFYIYL